MDRARLLRRRQGRAAAQVEHQDLVAGAVHAGDVCAPARALVIAPRSSITRAPSFASAFPQILGRRCRRAISPARASASALGGAFRTALSSCGGSGPCRNASRSTQRQPKMRIDARDDASSHVARLQREGAVDPSTSVAGALGPSGSRLAPRGGHCNCTGRAKAAICAPTISGQSLTRLASPRPRAASARPHKVVEERAERRRRRRAGFSHRAARG